MSTGKKPSGITLGYCQASLALASQCREAINTGSQWWSKAVQELAAQFSKEQVGPAVQEYLYLGECDAWGEANFCLLPGSL